MCLCGPGVQAPMLGHSGGRGGPLITVVAGIGSVGFSRLVQICSACDRPLSLGHNQRLCSGATNRPGNKKHGLIEFVNAVPVHGSPGSSSLIALCLRVCYCVCVCVQTLTGVIYPPPPHQVWKATQTWATRGTVSPKEETGKRGRGRPRKQPQVEPAEVSSALSTSACQENPQWEREGGGGGMVSSEVWNQIQWLTSVAAGCCCSLTAPPPGPDWSQVSCTRRPCDNPLLSSTTNFLCSSANL